MTKSIHFKLIAAIAILIAVLALTSLPAFAQSKAAVCEGVTAAGGNCAGGVGQVNKVITFVLNTLSVIVAVVSVIYIIWGGFKYVTSSGDASNVQSAKNTIMYAIVGLIVVALAQAIVNYVLQQAT